MAYERLNLQNGQIFGAEHVEHMEDGIEEAANSGGGVAVTAEVGQTIRVKAVDENGKPTEWESADYQPRTHWTEETVILPETTVDANNEVEFPYVPMVEGNEYRVVYNGAEYMSHCCVLGTGILCIGNVPLMLGTGDNGMPFAFFAVQDADSEGNDQSYSTVTSVVGDTSITIFVAEVEHTPIPAQYVTNAFPYYIEVTDDYDANNGGAKENFSCNETVANLEAIYNSGRPIVIRLTYFDVENSVSCWDYYHLSSVMFNPNYNANRVFSFVKPMFASNNNQPTIVLESKEDGTYTVGYRDS